MFASKFRAPDPTILASALVRASSEAAVQRPGKAEALLGDPPVGRAGSAVASSPRAALGLAPRTPGHSLQSHSFSRAPCPLQF